MDSDSCFNDSTQVFVTSGISANFTVRIELIKGK
jgi:hypothetical protein